MMRTLLWKEYREQRTVWLTLALASGAALYGLSCLMALDGAGSSPKGLSEPLIVVAVLLCWTYGMVCGSILLAGEREEGTLTFLDTLPVRRLHLWLVKYLVGLVLLLGQVAVLSGFVIGLGMGVDVWQSAGVVLLMLLFGLIGMSWGLLFSSRCESAISAIGLAIVGQIGANFAAGLLSFITFLVWRIVSFSLLGQEQSDPISEKVLIATNVLFGIALTLAALIGSARLFSRTDRRRRREAEGVRGRSNIGIGASWVRLLWLNYTQMRRLLIGMVILALALGFLVPAIGPMVWPFLTLLIGVLCGVTVCSDEQAHGSFRFLGDQRLPLGRVWLIKLGMRFALAVFASFLLMLPSLILTVYHRVESPSMSERQPPFIGDVLHSCLVGPIVPTGIHLTIWLLYGFSVGQLSGLLFRKSLVAAFVALSVSAMLVSLWVPSLLGIGLHFWQIAGVPLVLLLTAGTLVPSWVANRLLARATFVRLGAAFLAVGLWIAVGLWYRVIEVPDVPDQLDMPAFVASLPPLEENEAGQHIRSAVTKFDALKRTLLERRQNPQKPQPDMISVQVVMTLERGWPKGNKELDEWLNALFQDNWLADLAAITDLPVGVLDDPRRLTVGSRLPLVEPARRLNVVLAARGLQQQAAGHEEVFADNLGIGLAMARTLQHDSPLVTTLVGRATEGDWLSGVDRWLEKLRGHPKLLARVLRTLQRHEAELPEEREPRQTDCLIALNTLEDTPEQLVNMAIERRDPRGDNLAQAEIHAAALAWLFPWEHERHRRILRVVFQGDLPQIRKTREWGGVLSDLRFSSKHLARPKRGLARLHASQLQVALRWYQAETGKPAATLNVLVPRYLPTIPVDPFDGRPLRYRLSKGEHLGWPTPPAPAGEIEMEGAQLEPPGGPPTRFVPKGQGILWSVGEDGRDDGGVRQSQSTQQFGSRFGEDIIYLVPPAK